jgi:hypothetical protein
VLSAVAMPVGKSREPVLDETDVTIESAFGLTVNLVSDTKTLKLSCIVCRRYVRSSLLPVVAVYVMCVMCVSTSQY